MFGVGNLFIFVNSLSKTDAYGTADPQTYARGPQVGNRWSRGLAFRGDSEVFGCPKNGNYLGCLELISKFDPFLEENVKKFGNPGKGKVSYLSTTICNEFIEILATNLHLKIVSEVKQAKYFGISIDSTPDIAHIDQLIS